MKDRPPCRLFAVLAREAPVAAIFRRGPSDWVRLIKWHTDTDELEFGHWFHGRIYEKQCDLSPDGTLLIYFALKITGRTTREDYTHVWTAISRPPWSTALALWFKGDCLFGGGLFQDGKTIWLDHQSSVGEPDKGHLPSHIVVTPVPDEYAGIDSLYETRLNRDGWTRIQNKLVHEIAYGFATNRPEIWSKPHPSLKIDLLMVNSNRKFDITSDYSLEGQVSKDQQPVSGAAWADWDHRGRLVFAKGGKLFAADASRSGELLPAQIADFNNDEPAQILPPEWAMSW